MTTKPADIARIYRDALRHIPIESLIGADGRLDPDRLDAVRHILEAYEVLVRIPAAPHPTLTPEAIAYGAARFTPARPRTENA